MSEGPRGTRPRETAEMTFNIPTRVPGGFGKYLKRPFPSCGNLTCEGKKKKTFAFEGYFEPGKQVLK